MKNGTPAIDTVRLIKDYATVATCSASSSKNLWEHFGCLSSTHSPDHHCPASTDTCYLVLYQASQVHCVMHFKD